MVRRILPLLALLALDSCSDDNGKPPTNDGLAADMALDHGPVAPLAVTCDANPKSGNPPLAVGLSAQASGGAGGYAYAWDLGDGSSAAEQNPTRTYPLVGKVSATVTVTSGAETKTCTVDIAVAVDKTVDVPAGGGKAQLPVQGKQGQALQITLTAADTTLEPYGYLEMPDATGVYVPEDGNAASGVNSGQVTLTQDGAHVYHVHDSQNIGGQVNVKIE